ncbi:hypothetical protein [Thauera aromatica]|uniref:Uncharacterized protein n=1 Tax=Thauera aromatica K172 TaxID=44139 RepID=A0A2R4BIX6_THAAR|nr:hypothetical protein [Thauera aromatica]AVR87249.1 hypothetical protein Tharo_0298 [Thauera aromatica K172]
MTDPALLLAHCWGVQLPLMLAMAVVWVLHGTRDGVLRQWLDADHHTLWHWALGFALPAAMPVVLGFDLPTWGRMAVAAVSALWAAAALGELAAEWRRVPGPQYRVLMALQALIAGIGAWAGVAYAAPV